MTQTLARTETDNPLIAAVANITEEHVSGLQAEIESTERYLAGLKAMMGVAVAVTGLAAEEPPKTKRPYTRKPPVEVRVTEVVPEPAKEPEPEPVKALTAGDVEDDEPTLEDELEEVIAIETKPLPKKKMSEAAKVIVDQKREENRMKKRRQIAKYLQQKGPCNSRNIMMGVGVAGRYIGDVMTYPWFTQVGIMWQLTEAGHQFDSTEVAAPAA